MVDPASDHDSAINLIVENYFKLQQTQPEHELLQYITEVNHTGFDIVKEQYDKFFDRFETPEDKTLEKIKLTKVYCAYATKLIKANKPADITSHL